MQWASVQPTRGVAGTIHRYGFYPTAVLPFGITVAYLDGRQAERASYQKGPWLKEVVVRMNQAALARGGIAVSTV